MPGSPSSASRRSFLAGAAAGAVAGGAASVGLDALRLGRDKTDGGRLPAPSVRRPLDSPKTIEDFGGDGSDPANIDNTQAFLAAFGDPVRGIGEGETLYRRPGGRGHYTVGSLAIPVGRCLDLGVADPGGATVGQHWNQGDAPHGAIFLSGGSIDLARSASLRNGFVLNANLPRFPATKAAGLAALQRYSGTAITTSGGQAVYGYELDKLMIVGFAQAARITAQGNGRISRIKGDCTSGLALSGSFDKDTLRDIEFGNYFLGGCSQVWRQTNEAIAADAEEFYRAGTAFHLHDSVNEALLDRCYAVGYEVGIHLHNMYRPTLRSCGCDGYDAIAAAHATTGVLTTGFVDRFSLLGGHYDVSRTGADLRATATRTGNGSHLVHGAGFASRDHNIKVGAGVFVDIDANRLVNRGDTQHIEIGPGVGGADIGEHNQYIGIPKTRHPVLIHPSSLGPQTRHRMGTIIGPGAPGHLYGDTWRALPISGSLPPADTVPPGSAILVVDERGVARIVWNRGGVLKALPLE